MRNPNILQKFLCVVGTVFLLVSLSCASSPESTRLSSPVTVLVNDEPIHEDEVIRRMQTLHGELDGLDADSSQWQRLREEAVEVEILEKLILQAARDESITATPEEVRRAMDQADSMIEKRLFKEMLKQRGASRKDFAAFLRDRIIVEKFTARLFQDIEINEKMLREYYVGHAKDQLAPPRLKLAVLLLDTLAEARKAYKRLAAGERFEEVRGDATSGARTKNAFQTRWMPYDPLPQELREPIKNARPGELLNPVQGVGVFYVVIVVDKREAGVRQFDEVRDMIEKKLRTLKEQELLARWQETAVSQAEIIFPGRRQKDPE